MRCFVLVLLVGLVVATTKNGGHPKGDPNKTETLQMKSKHPDEEVSLASMLEPPRGVLRVTVDFFKALKNMTKKHEKVDELAGSAEGNRIVEEIKRSTADRHPTSLIAEGLRAEGDPRLIRIALHNLLDNACKFSSGREDPRVELFEVDEQQAVAEGTSMRLKTFCVRDNGAGFDMRRADRLFGAFRRLHSEKAFPGSGIGLATVQRIIRRHGGTVRAEAEVDKGASFFFTLPSR